MKRISIVIVVLATVLQMGTAFSAAPTQSRPAVLNSNVGTQDATCTSTDGQSTCVCGAKCRATAAACECYGIPPSSNSSSRKPGLDLLAPGGKQKATCTSGDGKKSCACGDQGCHGTPSGCYCITD